MFAKSGGVLVTLALSGLVLSGCSKPPVAEMNAADAALAAAVAAGAEEYVPSSVGSVRDLRSQLDAELAAQAEKFTLTRSYDHALELANQMKVAAEETATETARVKEETRMEVTALIGEVQVALAGVQQMLRDAPRGKGSAMDLAALQADLDSAAATLTQGETALADGRYAEAKAKILAVQSGTQSVKSAIEAAIRIRTGR